MLRTLLTQVQVSVFWVLAMNGAKTKSNMHNIKVQKIPLVSANLCVDHWLLQENLHNFFLIHTTIGK